MLSTGKEIIEEQFKKKTNRKQFIPTGFENIDNELIGLSKGELCIIGGRSGMGTTTLGIQLALQMGISHRVVFWNIHHSSEWMGDKLISQISHTPFQEVRNQKAFKVIDKNNVVSKMEKLHFNLFKKNRNLKDLNQLLSVSNKIEIIIIDYLQLLEYENQIEFMHEESGMAQLKRIAEKNNILIIALSQVSREVEERGGENRPRLGDILGPKRVSEFADKVFLMYRPEYYGITEDYLGNTNHNHISLELVKNTSGALHQFQLMKDNNFTHFIKTS